MELTAKKLALIQKIMNAKLTKEELQQVITKAESLLNKQNKKP